MRAGIRKILTWLFFICFTGILIPVGAEFFIEVAKDKGIYSDAGKRWDSAMTTLASLVTVWWITYPVVCLGGLVAGLWLDIMLKRNIISPDDPTDRISLADKIDDFTKRLSRLHGAWQAEGMNAWEDDTTKMMSKDAFPSRERKTAVDARYTEKFSEGFLQEMWELLSKAKKFVALPQNEMWRLSSGYLSQYDLHHVIILMSSISTALRSDRQDVPYLEEERFVRRLKEHNGEGGVTYSDRQGQPGFPKSQQ